VAGEYDIQIGAYRFDPLQGPPETPPPEAAAAAAPEGEAAGPEPVIVQFQLPLDPGSRARLERQYGLRLRDYIPNLAFLERLQPSTARSLEADELVRAVFAYQPRFKLDPELGRRTFRTPERSAEGVVLLVIGHPGSAVADLRAAVEALGFEVRNANEQGEPPFPRLVVPVGELADAEAIARVPDVRWIEEVGELTLRNATTSWVIQTNVVNDRAIWQRGIRGNGQVIGHIDGLLDLTHCFFRDDLDNTPRPGHRKVVGFRKKRAGAVSSDHGTFTAGVAAGEDVGAGAESANPNPNNGNAPRARLTYGYVPDLDIFGGTESFFDYLFKAHDDGARIHTNSWGDGAHSAYTQLTADLDHFTFDHETDLVIVAGDNGGDQFTPENAKNALVVNATRQHPNQGDFFRGVKKFTQDGRRLPTVMAPGENIHSADDGTPCGITVFGGASAAAPAVAGAAALVRQYFMEGWYPTGTLTTAHSLVPTGALLKATLINATVDATGIPGYPGAPTSGEGWGRILLEEALFFEGQQRRTIVKDVPRLRGLVTGQSATHRVDVVSSAEPLKVTLVWTEPPAAAGSATPVINNLDLKVTAPGGAQTFLGNNFDLATGVSIPGGTADALNNVEIVLVAAPATGRWTITVTATAVPLAIPGQGYALVVSGDVRQPSKSGPCVVATVVYADPAHPDVAFLRSWRDAHLVPGARGRAMMRVLVAVYARLGPPLAMALAGRPRAAAWLRRLVLAPAVSGLRRRTRERRPGLGGRG
jgi:hypothetical protein